MPNFRLEFNLNIPIQWPFLRSSAVIEKITVLESTGVINFSVYFGNTPYNRNSDTYVDLSARTKFQNIWFILRHIGLFSLFYSRVFVSTKSLQSSFGETIHCDFFILNCLSFWFFTPPCCSFVPLCVHFLEKTFFHYRDQDK